MSRVKNLASERGAVLVQTAVAAFVLVGFGAFVIDYGILWIGRHQAQNAADAGAMAGALARAYEDFDEDAGGVAGQMAGQVAAANLVWGESSPDTAAVTSFDCPPEIGGTARCVRVNVYRNGEGGSQSLPTLFGPLLGIGSQGMKATASARVHIANATNCLRPFAIPDKWNESAGGPEFNKYGPGGVVLTPHDDYVPPDAAGPGTGLKFPTSNATPEDLGLSVPLTFYSDLTDPIVPGWLVPLDPPGSTYDSSRAACNGQTVAIGDQLPIRPTPPIPFDFHNFFAADSGANWDAGSRTIHGSCAPGCAPYSPRLIAVAVFDVDLFQHRRALDDWNSCDPPGVPCVSVVNIVGLFMGDPLGSGGTLTSYPGLIPTEAPRLTAASSFLKAVNLVR